MACDHRVLHECRMVSGVVTDGMSGAEALPVGLQHQHLDVVVTIGIEQGGVHLFGELLVLRVGLLGPVQGDLRDRPILLVDDSFASLVHIHMSSWQFRYDVMTPISAPMS